ncbi:MAG: hypothetical protein RLZZ373_3168 [Pseudomonadota bacterium]
MKVSEYADQRHAFDGVAGLVLSQDEVRECFLVAARFYAAHGAIRALAQYGPTDPDATDWLPTLAPTGLVVSDCTYMPEGRIGDLPAGPVALDTDLTNGEASLICPLGNLYCERANALRLEASRAMGVEFYGRSVSEIAGAIVEAEAGMNRAAFVAQAITVY